MNVAKTFRAIARFEQTNSGYVAGGLANRGAVDGRDSSASKARKIAERAVRNAHYWKSQGRNFEAEFERSAKILLDKVGARADVRGFFV